MQITHKIFLLLSLCLVLSNCQLSGTVADTLQKRVLVGSGFERTLQVEIASTQSQQEMGLMNRKKITNGMMFEFQTETMKNFWMKNTLVPLDILFFSKTGSLVSHATMYPCRTQTCAITSSVYPVMYALEMPAGFIRSLPSLKNLSLKISE